MEAASLRLSRPGSNALNYLKENTLGFEIFGATPRRLDDPVPISAEGALQIRWH